MKDSLKVIHDMWLKGWDERNGGNFSYRLTKEETADYVDDKNVKRTANMFPMPELDGDVYMFTGSGKYFRNVIIEPSVNLGIIKITDGGKSYQVLWGFDDGAVPTSELTAHLASHLVRKKCSGGKNRVIIHTHSPNLIALTFVLDLDTKSFTKSLWQMHSECIVVFPEGIGVLPWLCSGTDEIGNETAKLMEEHRMVLWAFHGIFGAGQTIDEAFGLIDTAEKAAEILIKVNSMGGIRQKITTEELKILAKRFNVHPKKEILEA